MSRPLLVERLRRLQRTGVLERRVLRGKQTEYRLTAAGRELQRLIEVLREWGARWAFGDPRPNELDPIVLLWWMHRRVARDAVMRRRVVVEFDFRGGPKQRYWLLIEPKDVSICLKHPGFDVDVIVTADIRVFYRVWLGLAALSDALRREQIRLDGSPADLRAFPQWFTWSPMADTVRSALADRRTLVAQSSNKRPERDIANGARQALAEGS